MTGPMAEGPEPVAIDAGSRSDTAAPSPLRHRLANRRRWHRLWTLPPWAGTSWERDPPPEEIVALLEADTVLPGGALDIGCGAGPATSYLARSFRPTCGVDFAPAALAEARRVASAAGTSPHLVLAEAPTLPFRSASFTLVVDRGCFQSVPSQDWPAYFREASRLLSPGGVLQLSVTRPLYAVHPLLSPLGVKRALSRLVRGVGPSYPTPDQLRSLGAPTLIWEWGRQERIRSKLGRPYLMTVARFRRTSPGASEPA